MTREFKTPLPKKFVENTLALCGTRGQEWLEKLPDTVSDLETKWSIRFIDHFRNLSYNFVANVKLADGKSAVLKIALPLEDAEIYGEAAYLKTINGDGAVRLLGFDREDQAMLLERIAPGANLRSVCKREQWKAVDITIEVLKRILRPIPEDTGNFISLDDWFDGLNRAKGTTFPQDYANTALTLYEDLSKDKDRTFLLHGDIHHDNILSSTRGKFLVIDPKGMIGHVGYDIGVFLNNHHDWLEWDTRLEGKLDTAISEFANAFGLDEIVIRKWAFCQMVLSWWWLFDEMPGTFGEELGLSDVWKV